MRETIAKISEKQRRVLAVVLGCGLLALLLALVSLDGRMSIPEQDLMTIRELKVAAPPPPPPPVQTTKRNAAQSPQIGAPNQASLLDLLAVNLDVQMPAALFDGVEAGDGTFGEMVGGNIGMEWGAVSLSELDGLPMVAYEPLFRRPPGLVKSGVKIVHIEAIILIDENGKVFFKRMLKNPYPEYEEDFKQYINNFVFTLPRVKGVPTATAFIWPIALLIDQ